MKNKRLGITLGKTTNVGNYESVKVEISVSGDIGGSVFADVIEKLSDEGHELLEFETKKAVHKHHEG